VASAKDTQDGGPQGLGAGINNERTGGRAERPGYLPLKGGDWFRRGSVRRRRHLEALSPRKSESTALAANNQLALAA
jgi:hypothetical protein